MPVPCAPRGAGAGHKIFALPHPEANTTPNQMCVTTQIKICVPTQTACVQTKMTSGIHSERHSAFRMGVRTLHGHK